MMRPVFKFFEEIEEILEFLVNAGYTPERLKYKPLSKIETAKDRKVMREMLIHSCKELSKGRIQA